jgi:hypothetical protein
LFPRPIVGAHTNLTEIDEAFKLYWRVGVDPKQMVFEFLLACALVPR